MLWEKSGILWKTQGLFFLSPWTISEAETVWLSGDDRWGWVALRFSLVCVTIGCANGRRADIWSPLIVSPKNSGLEISSSRWWLPQYYFHSRPSVNMSISIKPSWFSLGNKISIFCASSILHLLWHLLFSFYLFFFKFLNFYFFLNFKIFNSCMRSQTWTPLPPPSP